jgi:hypothetical protein
MGRSSFVVAAVGILLLSLGCGDATAPSPQGASTGPSGQGPAGEMAETIQRNLAKLSQADRAAAEKQHHCPVSGEPLGSMGVPIKLEVKGREVWICCDACQDKLTSDPDKYLSQLK